MPRLEQIGEPGLQRWREQEIQRRDELVAARPQRADRVAELGAGNPGELLEDEDVLDPPEPDGRVEPGQRARLPGSSPGQRHDDARREVGEDPGLDVEQQRERAATGVPEHVELRHQKRRRPSLKTPCSATWSL